MELLGCYIFSDDLYLALFLSEIFQYVLNVKGVKRPHNEKDMYHDLLNLIIALINSTSICYVNKLFE